MGSTDDRLEGSGASLDEDDTPVESPSGAVARKLRGCTLDGTYELIEPRASGGMGAIWTARHTGLGTFFVVKVLHEPYCRDQSYVKALFREARVTARLSRSTDYIVPVVHVGEQDGLAYYVMEDLRGLDLQDYLDEDSPLSLEETRRLLGQMLQGVAVAHERGVVHRDLKPRNMFVELERTPPRLRILDFGIARAREFLTTTNASVPGDRQGTIQYMPPELLSDSPGEPTAAGDVFALGLVAYQMICGRHPLQGFSPAQVAARYAAGSELARLDETDQGKAAGIPAAFADVISRALALDPTRRFADAVQMLEALEALDEFDPTNVSIGTMIKGRYRVVDWLGAGGMGSVYEVEDIQRGDIRRALKISALPPSLPDDQRLQFLARFDQECAILRDIRHEGLVRLTDKDRHQGFPYYVMELARGEPLDDAFARLMRQPDGWARILHLLAQVADTLDTVHRAGVIHRDIKPNNILIDAGTGRARLIDFGIARVLDAQMTGTGLRLGTPGFSAPEQLMGRGPTGGGAVAASDQWALAATLYFLLSGLRPGQNPDETHKTLELDQRVLAGDIVPLSGVATELAVPVAVSDVVMRALASKPGDRFPTVAAFISALDAAGDGVRVPPTARTGGSAPSDLRGHLVAADALASTIASAAETAPQRRRPFPRAIVAVVVVVAVLAVALAVSRDRAEAPDQLAPTTPPTTQPTVSTKPDEQTAPDHAGPAVAAEPASTTTPERGDAPPGKSEVRVLVRAEHRGRAREGVDVRVGDRILRSPTRLTLPAGPIDILVNDRRYRPTTTQCEIEPGPESICVVELRRKHRPRSDSARSSRPGPTVPILDVVEQDEPRQ